MKHSKTIKKAAKYTGITLLSLLILLISAISLIKYLKSNSSNYKVLTAEEIEARKESSLLGLELLRSKSPSIYAFYQRYDSIAQRPEIKDRTSEMGQSSTVTKMVKGEVVSQKNENNKYDVKQKDAFFMWFGESHHDTSEVIKRLSVAIHESYHIYTLDFKKDSIINFPFHFLSGMDAEFIASPSFPAKEIEPLIPSDFSKYKNYTKLNSHAGIFVLINEWHAYYYGLKVYYDLKEYTIESSKNGLPVFFSYFNAEVESYFAFKLFILNYLNHAKLKHPEVYTSLTSDNEFIDLIKRIDEDYQVLINDYYAFRKGTFENAQNDYFKIELNEGVIIFEPISKRGEDGKLERVTFTDIMPQIELYEIEFLKYEEIIKTLGLLAVEEGQSVKTPLERNFIELNHQSGFKLHRLLAGIFNTKLILHLSTKN